MIRQRHRVLASIYLGGDLLATAASFFIAWALRFQTQILGDLLPLREHQPELSFYLKLLPVILLVWPVVFYFHGLYQIRRGRSRVDEVLTVVAAVLVAGLLLSVFIAWYRPVGLLRPDGSSEPFTYSRSFLALFASLNLALVSSVRMTVRYLRRQQRLRGRNPLRILIIGAGALGKEITQKILGHQELGFEVVGFLDDDPGKAGSRILDIPVLGRLDQVESTLEEQRIDQVFIALPLEAHRKMLRILQQVGSECVDVKLVPDILQYATLKASLEDMDGMPVINLSQVPLQGWSSLVKRAMDVGVAGFGLLLCLPFLPVVAALIWLEDRGPIFYRQERMGLDGKPFMIWKLRSMRVDAESTTGPVWAVKGDPRRTRVGAFLRRWSVDELPQLWNVLVGDMSIVGPRPERPTFVREFKDKVPQYMLRHRVRSGITGWAQVHGWRGNTSIRKRIQYDLYYIENWSLMLDLKILWMTLRRGLWHNAY